MKKKILSLFTTAILIMIATTCPVMAGEYGDKGTWDYTNGLSDGAGGYYGGTFTYSGEAANDGEYNASGKVLVKAEISSTYTIKCPSVLNLNPVTGQAYTHSGTADIECYGNVSNEKAVRVKIPASVTLTGAASGITSPVAIAVTGAQGLIRPSSGATGLTGTNAGDDTVTGAGDTPNMLQEDFVKRVGTEGTDYALRAYEKQILGMTDAISPAVNAKFSFEGTSSLTQADTYNGSMTVEFRLVDSAKATPSP